MGDGRRWLSGLEVWEIIAPWKEAGDDWQALIGAYAELSESQVRAAIAYYTAYPEEIEERLGARGVLDAGA